MSKPSYFRGLVGAPDHFAKLLNLREDEKGELSLEQQATLTELEALLKVWLKVKGDRTRFRISLLRSGRSARAFSEYTVHETATLGTVVTPVSGSSHAEGIFLQFMLHPDNWRLSGPCQRCGDYFVRDSRHKRTFCSQKCGKYKTATESTKSARNKHRENTLRAVNVALLRWRSSPTTEDWLSYVSREAELTRTLLTRWYNSGSIVIPIKQGEEA